MTPISIQIQYLEGGVATIPTKPSRVVGHIEEYILFPPRGWLLLSRRLGIKDEWMEGDYSRRCCAGRSADCVCMSRSGVREGPKSPDGGAEMGVETLEVGVACSCCGEDMYLDV